MMKSKKKKIAEIPVIITQEHNQVFYYWHKSGIKNATLLHVDGHSDMGDSADFQKEPKRDYYRELTIENFICPAVHYGIVSKVYWVNPHASEREKLHYFGSKKATNLETRLMTVIEENCIMWYADDIFDRFYLSKGIEEIHNSKISLTKKFILDIDLDAFCTHKKPFDTPKYYRGFKNWKKRVDETMELLDGLKTPDLITITRSVSSLASYTFVPLDKVDSVQMYTLEKLREVYGK